MKIKLTITFLDSTTDERVYKIYQANYYKHGPELGEIGITSQDKVKTITILPYNKGSDEEEGVLTINDFTTYLVLKFKIAEIKTETIVEKTEETEEKTIEKTEEKTTEKTTETECESCKVELNNGNN